VSRVWRRRCPTSCSASTLRSTAPLSSFAGGIGLAAIGRRREPTRFRGVGRCSRRSRNRLVVPLVFTGRTLTRVAEFINETIATVRWSAFCCVFPTKDSSISWIL
jgi:hypothetical protein